MTTTHDDLPHPVPAYAHLRYKENYFFIIMGQEENVFGSLHFNNEPGFDRTKISFDFLIKGKRVTYNNIVPISPRFGEDPFVTDGVAKMTIHQSHKHFTIEMKTEELELDLTFRGRMPTFDSHACKYAAPDQPSFRDVATFGLNLPLEHHVQSMLVSGTVRSGEIETTLDCLGYRDHSWGLRVDTPTAWHTWSVINFPERSFLMFSQVMQVRTGLISLEGGVMDAAGTQALRRLEIIPFDFSANEVLPARMLFEATDVEGQTYSLEADIAGRMAQLGVQVEVGAEQMPYTLTDNYCTIRDRNSGETGIGLVELGFKRGWPNPFR